MDITIRDNPLGMDVTIDDKAVTLPGAARITGMSVAHLRRLARRRVLESEKFQGVWLVTIASLRDYTRKVNESR